MTVADQTVTLPTRQPAVEPAAVAPFGDGLGSISVAHDAADAPGEAGIRPDEYGTGPSSSDPAEPVAEPRYTYDEFMQQFEPELRAAREQAIEEGYAHGQTQGMDEGRDQGVAEYASKLQGLAELLSSARKNLDQEIDGTADIAVEIVYEAVTKIIGEQMTQRDAVIATVREIVRRAKDRSRLVARVASHDLDLINGQGTKLIEGLNVGDIELVADDRVSLGGCLLETPAGNLDGRLEIQLQQLRDALLSARAGHG